jgi:hypothetical protein
MMIVRSRRRTCATSGDPRRQGHMAQSDGDKCLGPDGTLGYVSHESK